MSSLVVLSLLALVVAVCFAVRYRAARSGAKRGRTTKAHPPDLERGLAKIDATTAAYVEGCAVSDEELRACGLAVQSLYRHLSLVDRTEDNAKFSPQHRVKFYLAAVKVAALDHPDHNAWPLMSSIRRAVFIPLRSRLEADQDAWIKLALITPALLQREVELAVALYRELPDGLARVARAWVLESAVGYADFNDPPSSLRFLQQVKAPTEPALPAQDPLDAARRWAISVAVHPSYARDPRAALEDPLPAAVCRLALERWWDITDAESALATITWLRHAGHGEQLAEALLAAPEEGDEARARFLEEHAGALRAHEILAWDLCRLVQVARTCSKAGYLSEQQAWSFILPVAVALQQEYSSWDEMGEDYLLGNRYFASGGEAEPTHRASVEWLRRSPQSPWRRLPWDLPLD